MADTETWTSPTPRDEMLAQVVARGRHLVVVRRVLTGAVVATVAVAGAVGVAIGAAGGDESSLPAQRDRVALHGCPGEAEVDELRTGDRIFLTGRSADGEWLELRDPYDPVVRRWVRTAAVDSDQSVDALAVVEECDGAPTDSEGPMVGDEPSDPDGDADEELASGPDADDDPADDGDETDESDDGDQSDDGDGETDGDDPTDPGTVPGPGGTTGAPLSPGQPAPVTPGPGRPGPVQPSPRPTAPAPTSPPPTAPPTTQPPPTAPAFGGVSVSASAIRENFNGACNTNLPTASTVSVAVSHPSGISGVQMRRRIGTGSWGPWQQMSFGGGVASGQIGPYAAGTIPPYSTRSISWEVRATSGAGTTATRSSTANQQVTLHWCSLG